MISARSAAASCLTASVAVGASIAVTPFIVDYPVYAGQSARYAIAAVVLVAVLRRLDPGRVGAHPGPRQLLLLLLAAATGSAGFNVLLVAASRRADPAAIGAIVGASPVVLALLGAPRRGRLIRPRPRVVGGAVLATLGVAVLHGAGHSTPAGVLLAFGVLACEVAFTLAAAPLLDDLGPARVSAWSCSLAAGLLATASIVTQETVRTPTGSEAATLGYQGLILTAVAFVLWYRGVARLGPDRAGVTMAAAPLAAAGVAVLAGTGALTPRTLAGAIIVAAGVAVAVGAPQLSPEAPRPASADAGCRTGPRP